MLKKMLYMLLLEEVGAEWGQEEHYLVKITHHNFGSKLKQNDLWKGMIGLDILLAILLIHHIFAIQIAFHRKARMVEGHIKEMKMLDILPGPVRLAREQHQEAMLQVVCMAQADLLHEYLNRLEENHHSLLVGAETFSTPFPVIRIGK